MEIKKNIFLYPLSLIYGIVTIIRNILFDTGILRSTEFRIPLICVGNITVGGTGKTPHVEYIADFLRKNFKIVVLSRGYKRKTHNFQMADSSSTIDQVGDEPLQIFKKYPDITVAVDKNRVHGVNRILNNKPDTEVIILDDGFQHRSIIPGFSILLTDYNRLMIKDSLLPYGRLRERITGMRRADMILVTKCPEDLSPMARRLIIKEIDKAPYQNLYFTTLTYKNPLPVFPLKDEYINPLNSIDNITEIILLTGIANPAPLKKYLDKYSSNIKHLCYADHYRFVENDIEKIIKEFNSLSSPVKYIFTTEKDATRLREFTNIAESVQSAFWYIPVGIDFLNNDKNEFDNLIIDYVRKNKRDNRISEI
jgi:tetraacyldisaccharide 4'-kinase